MAKVFLWHSLHITSVQAHRFGIMMCEKEQFCILLSKMIITDCRKDCIGCSEQKVRIICTSLFRQVNLGMDLTNNLQDLMTEHSDTKLIIIDTLQKVREMGGDNYSYANDYEIITRLKKFADSYGICLMLVHHTRKQNSDDKFYMISGTNGLLGAADGGFILRKEKRTSNSATLEVSGRDQPDQKIYLNRNPETLVWDLERTETELWKLPPEPLLENIAGKITSENPEWYGSPTELVEFLGADMKANALTMKLNINAGRLFNEYGINYQNKRCHDGRKVSLTYEQRDDV